MAAPFPPKGNQKQQNEKPLRVYAEQFVNGASLPIGVVIHTATGEEVPPYLLLGGVYVPVRVTEWVISSRYTGQPIEVISAEEFAERFGPSSELT